MALISYSTITDGTTATASQVNTPLSTIYNDYNGNITDANIAAGAAIAGSKISLATISNPYKFSVYRSAAVASIASDVVIVMDTKRYDTGTNFNTTTGLFTAPIAGFYHISGQVGLAVYAGSFYWAELIYNSSTTTGVYRGNRGNNASALNVYPAINVDLQMAANDTIGLAAGLSTASALEVGANPYVTFLTGFLVSAT